MATSNLKDYYARAIHLSIKLLFALNLPRGPTSAVLSLSIFLFPLSPYWFCTSSFSLTGFLFLYVLLLGSPPRSFMLPVHRSPPILTPFPRNLISGSYGSFLLVSLLLVALYHPRFGRLEPFLPQDLPKPFPP